MNKVIVLGNVGRVEPLRAIPGRGHVAPFSVVSVEQWKDRNGNKKEHSEWFNVSVFGDLADECHGRLRKGAKVYIEGRQKTDEYQSDGITKRSVKLVVDTGRGRVVFMDDAPIFDDAAAEFGYSPGADTEDLNG